MGGLAIPTGRPELGALPTDRVANTNSQFVPARRTSASATRTASRIVSSGTPRCIDSEKLAGRGIRLSDDNRDFLHPSAREAHVESSRVNFGPDPTRRVSGAALHALHGRRLAELRALARVRSGHARHFDAVSRGGKRQVLISDAAHNYCAVLEPCEPIILTGLNGVADEDPLLSDSPRGNANVELALMESSLPDGVVDCICLSRVDAAVEGCVDRVARGVGPWYWRTRLGG